MITSIQGIVSATVMQVLHLVVGDGFQHYFYIFCARQRCIRADRNCFWGFS